MCIWGREKCASGRGRGGPVLWPGAHCLSHCSQSLHAAHTASTPLHSRTIKLWWLCITDAGRVAQGRGLWGKGGGGGGGDDPYKSKTFPKQRTALETGVVSTEFVRGMHRDSKGRCGKTTRQSVTQCCVTGEAMAAALVYHVGLRPVPHLHLKTQRMRDTHGAQDRGAERVRQESHNSHVTHHDTPRYNSAAHTTTTVYASSAITRENFDCATKGPGPDTHRHTQEGTPGLIPTELPHAAERREIMCGTAHDDAADALHVQRIAPAEPKTAST